jgi:peptidylprolyl isomerase
MRRGIWVAVLVLVAAACSPAVSTTEGPTQDAAVNPAGFECNPTGSEPDQFSAPQQVIDPAKDYVATMTMQNGDQVVIDLFPDKAPITVNNFVFLACQGFYDGLTFHRVIPGFMAQGGDPTGTGTGGPGYTIQDEHGNGLVFDRPGLISMAHTSQPNSAGSQFFITYSAEQTAHLTGTFTIFGEVTQGMDVVEAISPRDPATASTPGDVIQSIRVEESQPE